MANDGKDVVSPYTLLSRWFFDGSKSTNIPDEVVESKAISQLYILYYFQSCQYITYISKHFNNYSLFQMDKLDVYRFMKECVRLTGYKPPFVTKIKSNKSELVEILKTKYIFLKEEELYMLVKIIDESDEKDAVYEMFGLYKPKKKKMTKEQQNEYLDIMKNLNSKKQDSYSLNDLMGNFS